MSINQVFSADKNEMASLKFVDLSYTHLARMELCHLLDLTRHLDHLVSCTDLIRNEYVSRSFFGNTKK